MKQKTTFLFLLVMSCSGLIFGQTMVNDFEAGSTAPIDNAGGVDVAVVANPAPGGLNSTANCLQVSRSAGQWWGYVGINVDPDMSISDTDTRYVSMLVYYPASPDLGIRFDAPDDASTGGPTVRALNTYTNFNQWQEIVVEIKDSQTATSFTKGTLYRLTIHPDLGFENVPAGQVLDATTFGYIDEIRVLDNPLSTSDFELEKSISLYPNPAQSSFKITSRNNVKIENVSVYTLLGKQVQNLTRINSNEYDISSLASGVYIVKMVDNNGGIASKKLLKN